MKENYLDEIFEKYLKLEKQSDEIEAMADEETNYRKINDLMTKAALISIEMEELVDKVIVQYEISRDYFYDQLLEYEIL